MRRFAEGVRCCRWGCYAVGGDVLLHCLSCPAMLMAVAASPHLRAPVWAASGDTHVAFNCLPLGARDGCSGAVWLLCRSAALVSWAHCKFPAAVADCSHSGPVLGGVLPGRAGAFQRRHAWWAPPALRAFACVFPPISLLAMCGASSVASLCAAVDRLPRAVKLRCLLLFHLFRFSAP